MFAQCIKEMRLIRRNIVNFSSRVADVVTSVQTGYNPSNQASTLEASTSRTVPVVDQHGRAEGRRGDSLSHPSEVRLRPL